MTIRLWPWLTAVTVCLTACGGTGNQPLALQKVAPFIDEAGELRQLSDETGQPLTFLQAIRTQGIPMAVAKAALLKYERFRGQVPRQEYLVMVDMTQHSSNKRFFLVNQATGVVDAMPVAHGAGSDPKDSGQPEYFSNVPESKMSSLGSYIINERYIGKHGESMRLDGLERTNGNARARAIVIHSATYVRDGKDKQGRSWGCPALPTAWIKEAVKRLVNGSFMYIHGDNKHDTSRDEYWVQQWNMIPPDRWVNESEDAPLLGE